MTDPVLIDVPQQVRGERVVVRPFAESDALGLFEAIAESHRHLAPWMPWEREHRSPDDARLYIRRSAADWLVRKRLPVGVFDRADGRVLGGSGLDRIDWDLRRFEIGYWLRASAEGHGYMRETVILLTRLAFDHLGANRVEIRMDPRNLRSERVAARLGFELEGTLRNSSLDAAGLPADRRIYALIPSSYARLDWSTPGSRP